MEETNPSTDTNKFKLGRCIDWLQEQNHPKKLALQNKNDIQFIIETNAHRKKFLISTAEDEATVPLGVDEPSLEPKVVPLNKLRVDNLRMECEWQSCNHFFVDYNLYQKHVASHASDLHVMDKTEGVVYVCLWDICGYQTPEFNEMLRHINYHAYHGRLLAIGFNGRATLKLEGCRKDSSKRNQIPSFKNDHCCLWINCDLKFNAIQKFLDHIKQHTFYSEDNLCSWAGCGAKFQKLNLLKMHMRTHTGERLIACYHCGKHFSCNGKLGEHLARQNIVPESGYQCSMCGKWYASAYLVREHSRQHVSYFACSLCDMSAPTRAALATHVRYRHLDPSAARIHACPHCPYKAVTKWDLLKHIPTHERKGKKRKRKGSSGESEDGSDEEKTSTKKSEKVKERRKYACHMCPEKKGKVFTRGGLLTKHLVKVHGAQWPCGHSRFRYQISEDGMYRLTTTRLEDLEVSKKIVDGYSGPKESLKNTFDFDLKQVADATEDTPTQFRISFKIDKNTEENEKSVKDENEEESSVKEENIKEETKIEICTYNMDESGNIISSETTYV